jgi:integrase
MVSIDLKGLHRVPSKGRIYYYAWRGGPRLKGEPGAPEFIASYNEAVAGRQAPDSDRFRSLVTAYKASPDYKRLADTTKRQWSPWLDRIADHFGELSIAQFNRAERIKPVILKWRSKFADTPRTADFGMQVLSRVLTYAVDPLCKISSNPCKGISQLYSNNRSEIIWTEADIAAVKAFCSPEVALGIDLAACTGLRAGDLVRLSWSHIDFDQGAIILPTSKSGERNREAVIPLYQDLRDVLARIPRRSPVVLTSSKRRPWVSGSLGDRVREAQKKVWPNGTDLHFHDLRGTAATKFYIAGFNEREIAEILAWEEKSVSRIIRRYVGRQAAIKDHIRRLDEARSRT